MQRIKKALYVRMEKLQPITTRFKWGKEHVPFLIYLDKKVANCQPVIARALGIRYDTFVDNFERYEKKYGNEADPLVATFKEILALAKKTGRKDDAWVYDTGEGRNMMLRPGTRTIVFTDPLS